MPVPLLHGLHANCRRRGLIEEPHGDTALRDAARDVPQRLFSASPCRQKSSCSTSDQGGPAPRRVWSPTKRHTSVVENFRPGVMKRARLDYACFGGDPDPTSSTCSNLAALSSNRPRCSGAPPMPPFRSMRAAGFLRPTTQFTYPRRPGEARPRPASSSPRAVRGLMLFGAIQPRWSCLLRQRRAAVHNQTLARIDA